MGHISIYLFVIGVVSLMSEKIPMHNHCKYCGKAFIGEGVYCSEECMSTDKTVMSKRKRQLTTFYIGTVMVFGIVILLTLV